MVRTLTRQALRAQGYTVLDARHGTKAQEISEKFAKPIHLLLTDLVLPGMSGRDIADRALILRPQMKVLFMSGHPDEVLSQQGILPSGAAFVRKPFTPESLARKVREVLDSKSPSI
jgi:DNA-binding response OmpR family regulator